MHHFSTTESLRILVVEDNLGDLLLLKECLTELPISISSIESVDRLDLAVEFLEKNRPDIIFLDLYLPDSSGLCTYNQLKSYIRGSAVIILSGLSDTNKALDAIANGAQDYLAKGEFDEKLLVKTISYAMERVKSIETLRVANERYSLVAKATNDLVWDWDLHTDKLFMEEEATMKVYGWPPSKMRTFEDWNKMVHPADAKHVDETFREILNDITLDFFEIEYRFQTPEGDYRDIYDRGYITRNQEGKAIRIIGAANNITEKNRLARELQEERQRQQRIIAEATIRGQENERHQLGVELHDNITQILATSRLYLESALMGEDYIPKVKKSRDLIFLATKELRKLSHTLLPPSLHEFGLKQALVELTDMIAETGGFDIIDQWNQFEESLMNEDQQLTIYRIIQEQLNNIMKHAAASVVTISLKVTQMDSNVELLIKDNGRGFDPNNKRNGVGLRNIMSRAELHLGQVSINSKPGHGCELKVIFPVVNSRVSQTA